MKSGGRIPSTDLRLTPQEMRALGHVDGVRWRSSEGHAAGYETVLRVVFVGAGRHFVRGRLAPAPVPEKAPTRRPGARPAAPAGGGGSGREAPPPGRPGAPPTRPGPRWSRA
jgi:hypothetical protein